MIRCFRFSLGADSTKHLLRELKFIVWKFCNELATKSFQRRIIFLGNRLPKGPFVSSFVQLW